MWSRLGAAAALLAGALVLVAPLASPLAASAEEPVEFVGGYAVDTVGALAGRETEVQGALDGLYEQTDLQLFIVFVGTFENPSDAVEWADQTAIMNGLGARDLLLAIATTERTYALSVDDAFPLSDEQLDRVEIEIESYLVDDDWAGAVVGGADALESEAAGVVVPEEPGTDPGTTDPGTTDEGNDIPVLPIVGAVAVIGAGVFFIARARKSGKRDEVTENPDGMTQKELDQRAGSLLVQLDDSLKTSEQELGFAVAQFGDDATADFTATLAGAKQKVAQAFAIRQQLDDADPETTEQKRTLTTQIIQLCESADADLDAQADAFDELRSLEKNAPAALAAARKGLERVRAARAEAAASLTALSSTYAAAAVKPVADNLTQADKLLAFADESAKRADQAILDGKPSDAAIAVRTAQAGVGQVAQLFAAIGSLSGNLAEAGTKLDAVVADTTQDVAAARALPADARLTPAIASAEAALSKAVAAKGDPVSSLEHLSQANAALEQVFMGVRSEQEKVEHAKSQLDATLSGARAQVQAAAEFITTRRGGVGSLARTRVSEADRHLAQALALAASDPVKALAEAQSAQQLASNAIASARSDVEYFEAQQRERDYSYSGGSDGADLGGILGDLFGGGGYSSGGGGGGWFSGGSGSSRSGSGSSYRPSRSSRSSSFGGSSRSSRSSRSSSRSSGGGRSRGGRF
jgi:uncharacterized membrane protein YgcG